jgi:cardiolipin synthase
VLGQKKVWYWRKPTKVEILGYICIVLVAGWIFLALFAPHQEYRVEAPTAPLDSQQFVHLMQSVLAAPVRGDNKFTVLPNGESFYKAELEAIRSAQKSVNLEAYIFAKGEVMEQFVDALTERAGAGVKVNVVLDGLGSLRTIRHDLRRLIDAKGAVQFYHPLRWYSWDRYNNRTHREMLIVDGKVGFLGGAGVADWWLKEIDGKPRWRDTMVKIEGPAVADLQGVFAENWVEASGRVIVGSEYFPMPKQIGTARGMIIASPASASSSSRARMLMQLLVASAQKTIYISTPYFLPDVDLRREIQEARERGVDIKVITPGPNNDHLLTRSSSRRLYGELISRGVEIYEYRPSMIHQKLLLVDGVWSVVGSTNMDNRSFHMNDEVNLCAFDDTMTRELTELYLADLKQSHRMTYDEWKKRPFWDKAFEWTGKLIERQQ